MELVAFTRIINDFVFGGDAAVATLTGRKEDWFDLFLVILGEAFSHQTSSRERRVRRKELLRVCPFRGWSPTNTELCGEY